MAILTGTEIHRQYEAGHIKIDPYDKSRLQPNSYDLTLAPKITWYHLLNNVVKVGQIDKDVTFESYGQNAIFDIQNENVQEVRILAYLDTKQFNPMHDTEFIPEDGFILYPRILYLVETNETVYSDIFVPEITGCSSLARLGVSVHKTAGYANLGHEFRWILEVDVVHPVKIYPNMKIGQCVFHTTKGNTEYQYDGMYKDVQKGQQKELTGSLYNFDQIMEEHRKKEFDRLDAIDLEKKKQQIEEMRELGIRSEGGVNGNITVPSISTKI